MKTDIITVYSNGARMQTALSEVDKVAAYKGLERKQALQLRLLTEETMGMMRSITGETKGQFWIEDDDNEYRIHLLVCTVMDSEKREHLLAASSTGKNESAKGIMGRIRDFFDRGADADITQFSNPLLVTDAYDQTPSSNGLEWSFARYHDEIAIGVEKQDSNALAAWDEMEKSVVSHVADDIKVSIKGPDVEMVIVKKF